MGLGPEAGAALGPLSDCGLVSDSAETARAQGEAPEAAKQRLLGPVPEALPLPGARPPSSPQGPQSHSCCEQPQGCSVPFTPG